MRMCHKILFIAFLVLSARGASSQAAPDGLKAPQASVDPRPVQLPIIDRTDIRFARVSTADGLSQTKVDQIVQDDQGFMWFGTQYGLNRYDGYNFRVFIHDPGNPNSLSGVYIRSLFKDRDGTLWVGCDEFVNKFDPATETFTRYPVPFVSHISQDGAGMLWFASSTGLYGLDRATGEIRRYSHDPNDPSSLGGNDIISSSEDKEGRFWVANTKGLDELDRRTGRVTLHISWPGDPWRFSFYEDRFGIFWIFNLAGNALAVFDRKTNALTRYSFYKGEPAASTFAIRAVVEDRNDTLWLATNGAGLLQFDREHRRFIRYRNNPADPESLPQDNAISLYADREGNIWAGTGRLGLARFATKPSPFKRIPRDPSRPNSTIEPFVGAIYEDSQGILWIGTPESLNRIDGKAGLYTSYRTSGPGVGSDVITIRGDPSGNIWAGTYGHGLHRFDPRTGQFKTYRHDPADPHSLSNDYVSRLLVDHNGTLWAATHDTLNRFDSTTERFTAYNLDPQKDLFYQELVEDREGILWLGTDSSGLRRFDPATGRITMYQPDMKRPGTLSDNRVNAVHFDASGTMWLGTQNGLNKFDPTTSTFTVYTRTDGLPGNAVGCILEDGHGDLWMSTNNGVARFNPQTRTVKSYSTTDGLPGPDLTGWGACFKSPGGEMFFGGFSGATALFPDKVVDASYTPPIVLTDLRLPVNPAGSGSRFSLQRSVSYARSLILSHAQNVFSLSFAALSYSNSATNRYRYKLEDLEGDWNEVGSDRRQATYTTLPAGKYTFRVQGATSGGAWSEPGVELSIVILPPWWGTWWFRSACGIVILVSLWLASYLRIRRIAWNFNVRLEERVGERTRIARELHDTLLQSFHGLLFRCQAARNVLPRRPEEAIQALDGAISVAEQAIEEGRDAIQGLRSNPPVQTDLAQLLNATGQELARSQEVSGASTAFRVTEEGKRQDLSPILQDEVYRIARELLRNAFRHAQARQIEAEIRYYDDLLRLSIRDDGIGIEAKVLQDGERAGHWGLLGVRERAKRIGARLDLRSEAGAGTEVELTVPASVAYETLRRGPGFNPFPGKATKS